MNAEMKLKVLKVVDAGIAYPFGDSRSVSQAFPNPIKAEIADPFLMCDYFNMPSEKDPSDDPDHFPVDWHPHRGMDILSYFRTGLGRHGDSLGNRESFETPGMQWMSVGSGVEHAEGGGTKKGETTQGFQIWINVPSIYKMNDPIYGTEPPQNIPQEVIGTNAKARLLAGPMGSRVGAFKTKANVQIVDFDLEPGAEMTHTIPQGMSTVMLYIYEGTLLINHDQIVGPQAIAMLDGSNDSIRTFDLSVDLSSDSKSASAILFVGEPLKEPIAWRGPIVMNTKAELQQTFNELRSGSFPPVRVPWDYHCINQKPV